MQPHDTFAPATNRPLPVDPDELSGALAARRQLGPEAEDAVIASFLDRLARAVDQRVDERLAQHGAAPGRPAPRGDRPGSGARVVLAIFSMLFGTIVSGVALDKIHLFGLVVALFVWTVIGAINTSFGRDR